MQSCNALGTCACESNNEYVCNVKWNTNHVFVFGFTSEAIQKTRKHAHTMHKRLQQCSCVICTMQNTTCITRSKCKRGEWSTRHEKQNA